MTQYEIISNRITELRNKLLNYKIELQSIDIKITDETNRDDLLRMRQRQNKIIVNIDQINTLLKLNEKILMVTNEHEYQLEN
jgi:hypothetical protein